MVFCRVAYAQLNFELSHVQNYMQPIGDSPQNFDKFFWQISFEVNREWLVWTSTSHFVFLATLFVQPEPVMLIANIVGRHQQILGVSFWWEMSCHYSVESLSKFCFHWLSDNLKRWASEQKILRWGDWRKISEQAGWKYSKWTSVDFQYIRLIRLFHLYYKRTRKRASKRATKVLITGFWPRFKTSQLIKLISIYLE